MSWLTRLSFFCAAALCVATSTARAEFPNGGDLKFVAGEELQIEDDGDYRAADTDEAKHHLNMAHCQCSASSSASPTFTRGDFKYTLVLEGGPIGETTAEIWVGEGSSDCLEESKKTNTTVCRKTDQSIPDLDQLDDESEFTMRTSELMTIPEGGETCKVRQGAITLWILSPSSGVGGALTEKEPYAYAVDTDAPDAPSVTEATAVEGTITVEFDPNETANAVERYQALCLRKEGSSYVAAFNKPKGEVEYETTQSLCGVVSETETLTVGTVETKNGSVVDAAQLPADFLQMSPKYLCGSTSGSAGVGSIKIDGLEDDTEYVVAVIAVDEAGNASGRYLSATQVPVPVTDFWEDIHDGENGSEVEGGFCLIAETYGDGGGPTQALRAFRDETLAATAFGRWMITAYYEYSGGLGDAVRGSTALRIVAAVVLAPAVALALLWHALTLPGLMLLAVGLRTRRRWMRALGALLRRRARVAVAATTIVLVPSLASAQSFQPYWEEEEAALSEPDAGSRWHVGVKVGPYTPAIDDQYQDQTNSNRKPFKESFRGGMWLPVLEVDWLILNEFGQLGVGGSGGYTGDGAGAWAAGTTPGPNGERVDGDDMKFRMIPLTATVVYRATQLDDFYGIPFVPYARGGLAYTFWWMNSPNGDRSRLDPMDCEGRKCRGSGGSMGLTGSVGLAIRAERIDKNSALSMHESGIDHAGFYIEGSYGWIDGFGSDKKLALGALTWFGGINFEF
jgi:hypothetical protein